MPNENFRFRQGAIVGFWRRQDIGVLSVKLQVSGTRVGCALGTADWLDGLALQHRYFPFDCLPRVVELLHPLLVAPCVATFGHDCRSSKGFSRTRKSIRRQRNRGWVSLGSRERMAAMRGNFAAR